MSQARLCCLLTCVIIIVVTRHTVIVVGVVIIQKRLRKCLGPDVVTEPGLQKRMIFLSVFDHLLELPCLQTRLSSAEAVELVVGGEVEAVDDELPLLVSVLWSEDQVLFVPAHLQLHLSWTQ